MRYLKCFSVCLRINMHKTLVWNARCLSCKCFKFKSIRLLVHSSSNWFFLKHQGPHWHIWPHTNTVTIMASNDLSLLAILDRNTPTAAISHLITSVFLIECSATCASSRLLHKWSTTGCILVFNHRLGPFSLNSCVPGQAQACCSMLVPVV